ncbi:MAG: hypothetical protein LBM75_07775 [Myxococcales bacterium]|nr:hypothetical protein [Myxococcales bacterium]
MSELIFFELAFGPVLFDGLRERGSDQLVIAQFALTEQRYMRRVREAEEFTS